MKAYPQFKWMPIEEQYAPMGGMDLRDYFAAKVMGYWLSYPIEEQRMDKLSKCAYEVADAMMKAREK